ncbi:MAG: hypothetical protein KDA37_01295, partial [Planctomycetales bacterium]|nr:hypothetical protein [Planctomycetales bacterium]
MNRVHLRYSVASWALLLASTSAAQSDPGNFSTIIDLPPDVLPAAVGSDTQVNVLVGGAVGDNHDFGAANGSLSNIEVNVLGGAIGNYLDIYHGATVNLVSGAVGYTTEAYDGSHLNIMGGGLTGAFFARSGSTTTMSGGQIHQLVGMTGSTINISGGYVASEYSLIGSGSASDPPTVLNLSGGSLPFSFDAQSNSVVNMSDGFISRSFQSRSGSVVNLSGGRIYWYYSLEGELNMTGGSVGLGFKALNGATLNASGGWFESGAEIQSGATANFSGAQVESSLLARGGSAVRLSGGTLGTLLASEPGTSVTLVGAEFQLDGLPVTGLTGPGSQVPFVVPTGSLLSGTLADGTPFAFSTQDQDNFSEVVLEEATLPAIGPALVTASTDSLPLGIRTGQTLVVDGGATVRQNFSAGPGSTVNVLPGGVVSFGMEAIGAEVNVTGGEIDYGFDAMQGTTIGVSGGLVDEVEVFEGSLLTISGSGNVGRVAVKPGGHADILDGRAGGLFISAGGTATMSGGKLVPYSQNMFGGGGSFDVMGGSFAGSFSTTGGGQVQLHGGEFRLDGQPVSLDPAGTTPIEVPDGSVITGVLADGSPFAFSSLKNDRIGAASVSLVTTQVPDTEPSPIVLSQQSGLTGLRAGQSLIIEDGGVVGEYLVALEDSSIHLRGNGYIGNSLSLVQANLVMETGHASGFTLLAGSHAVVAGDAQTGNATLYASRLDVRDSGSVYYTYLRNGSHARIVGGEVSAAGRKFPIYVESGSHIEFSGDARTSGIELRSGTTGVIAGGVLDYEVDLLAGAELEIIATDFLLDGIPLADLAPGESLVWTERGGLLSGTFVSGQSFEFDLSASSNSFRSDYFDPTATLVLTRILAGDFDRSGAVDAGDYSQWLLEYGAEVAKIGDGADANYDGVVNAAD